MRLAKFLSVPEAARLAGISKERMRRRINALHSETDGGILVHVPARIHPQIDVKKLLRADKEFFDRSMLTIQEYETIQSDIAAIRKSIQSIERRLNSRQTAA
jgi:hypothetical protein